MYYKPPETANIARALPTERMKTTDKSASAPVL